MRERATSSDRWSATPVRGEYLRGATRQRAIITLRWRTTPEERDRNRNDARPITSGPSPGSPWHGRRHQGSQPGEAHAGGLAPVVSGAGCGVRRRYDVDQPGIAVGTGVGCTGDACHQPATELHSGFAVTRGAIAEPDSAGHALPDTRAAPDSRAGPTPAPTATPTPTPDPALVKAAIAYARKAGFELASDPRPKVRDEEPTFYWLGMHRVSLRLAHTQGARLRSTSTTIARFEWWKVAGTRSQAPRPPVPRCSERLVAPCDRSVSILAAGRCTWQRTLPAAVGT